MHREKGPKIQEEMFFYESPLTLIVYLNMSIVISWQNIWQPTQLSQALYFLKFIIAKFLLSLKILYASFLDCQITYLPP